MGNYLNPGSGRFRTAINSKIYVDKTGLMAYEIYYPKSVEAYKDNLRLIGINYDPETKHHTCKIMVKG
jgi:hypothetical protein